MSKYLAVIKDSFREAFASRVLWMLLIAITFVLAVLAPFGFREVQTTRLTDDDFRDPWEFMERIRKEGPKQPDAPIGRVWKLMDETYRNRLTKAKIPNVDREQGNPLEILGLFSDFVRQMNKLIERNDLFDRATWEEVPILTSEAVAMSTKQREGKLVATELPRFNRLMLEAAFSGMIRESPPTSIQWRYAWMNFGSPDPLSSDTIRTAIEGNAAWVLKWLVGVVGVLVAILVTSPIIPQMFDQGSLHLLLSKPVSRWMLLLAKFIGGCAYILLSASYLIIGLWLILGIRFGIWESRLLLSIPIYLFVFSIYYSVSSLAGVIWRSPIVSVAMSVLFWLACFVLGWALWFVEHVYIEKDRFIQVVAAKDSLIATSEMGWSYEWDESKQEWRPVFTTNDQRSVGFVLRAAPVVPRELRSVGPVYDQAQDRLIASVPDFPPRVQNLTIGQREKKWDPVSKTNSPLGTSKILVEPKGKVLFVASLGLHRLTGDPLAERKPVSIGGWNLPFTTGGPLQPVNPDPALLLTSPSDAAINQQSGELAIYTRATITILAAEKSRYKKRIDRRLDGEERQAAVIAFGGQHLVVGRFDGRIQVLDANTLETIHEHPAEKGALPRFIKASPDGRWFSVLRHNGRLSMYDANQKSLSAAPVSGQGHISGCDFGNGTLLVIDRGDRVSEYALDSFQLKRRVGTSMNVLLAIYRYGLWPFYVVFPKPSELDKTFDHLLSAKDSKPRDNATDLSVTRDTVDPWMPVWSSAAFTIAVLFAACVYIQFQEF
jgi:ABC-type transport system involved in multi-copper enzyme maturation permease subunit